MSVVARSLLLFAELAEDALQRVDHFVAADAALRKYESTDPADTATLYPIVQQLEKIMSTDVPEAPLLYGADWNVFSSAKYTGWPNQSHPYMNPSPSDPQMPYILMQLKPVS